MCVRLWVCVWERGRDGSTISVKDLSSSPSSPSSTSSTSSLCCSRCISSDVSCMTANPIFTYHTFYSFINFIYFIFKIHLKKRDEKCCLESDVVFIRIFTWNFFFLSLFSRDDKLSIKRASVMTYCRMLWVLAALRIILNNLICIMFYFILKEHLEIKIHPFPSISSKLVQAKSAAKTRKFKLRFNAPLLFRLTVSSLV